MSTVLKSSGLRAATRLLCHELGVYCRHRLGSRKARIYKGQVGLRLNIGCGPNRKNGWVNIDLDSLQCDLTLDMREAFPFRGGSIEMIYSEHFFEHLDNPGPAQQFLRECHRVLKDGGTLSVGVPDTQWALEAYVGPDDNGYFKQAKEIWHPKRCVTRLEHINYHFRQDGEHRFAYDFETLEHIIREAGFAEVKQRSFDPALDTENRKIGTLYVDAVK